MLRIKELKLLDPGEKILKFYSEYKKPVAGNFYTTKRIATYWIDEHDPSKNNIAYAYYPDIISIDTIYNAGASFSPYMLIKRKDSLHFKVSVGGKKKEIKSFFEEALYHWKVAAATGVNF